MTLTADDPSTGVPAVDAVVVWAAAIAAVAGMLGLLWRAARPIRRVVRLVEEFAEDWHGIPPRSGVEGRPGVMQRLERIERAMGDVVHEVRPNAGGSMRDAINRVDRRTASLAGDEETPPAGPPD